jgi:hypothetical protein
MGHTEMALTECRGQAEEKKPDFTSREQRVEASQLLKGQVVWGFVFLMYPYLLLYIENSFFMN